MDTETARAMFSTPVKEFIAAQMIIALQGVSHLGFRLTRDTRFSYEGIVPALERRGAPLIEEIIRDLKPAESENIRGLDPRVIWRIYWNLQMNSTGDVSILDLLRELNNPP